MAKTRRNTGPRRSLRSSVPNTVLDHYLVFWDAVGYAASHGLTLSQLAERLQLRYDSLHRWTSRGYTPLRVFKAMTALFGMPPAGQFGPLRCEAVERMPFQLPKDGVEPLRRQWDETHTDHDWYPRRMRNVYVREGPVTASSTLSPAPSGKLVKGIKPKAGTRRVLTPSALAAPYGAGAAGEAAGGWQSPPPANPLPAGHAPPTGEPTLPVATPIPAPSDEAHAGMQTLARLAESLLQERNQYKQMIEEMADQARIGAETYKAEVTNLRARHREALTGAERQIGDLKAQVASLTEQLATASKMLDEALAAPTPAPAASNGSTAAPKATMAEQVEQARDIVRASGSADLLKELDRHRPQ